MDVVIALIHVQDAHKWDPATSACECGDEGPETSHDSHVLLEMADAAEAEALWQASHWGPSQGAVITETGDYLIPASRLAARAIAIKERTAL